MEGKQWNPSGVPAITDGIFSFLPFPNFFTQWNEIQKHYYTSEEKGKKVFVSKMLDLKFLCYLKDLIFYALSTQVGRVKVSWKVTF